MISIFCCRQGEWKPREIDNPAYKGKWIHPEIDNPEYTADAEIYKYDSIGVIGLDLWQVKIQLLIRACKQTLGEKKCVEVENVLLWLRRICVSVAIAKLLLSMAK